MPFPTVPIEQAIFNSWSLFITSLYPDEKVRRLRDNYIAPAGEYTAIKLVDIAPVSSHAALKIPATDDTGRGGSYSNFEGTMHI